MGAFFMNSSFIDFESFFVSSLFHILSKTSMSFFTCGSCPSFQDTSTEISKFPFSQLSLFASIGPLNETTFLSRSSNIPLFSAKMFFSIIVS